MMNVTLDPGRAAEKNEHLNKKEQTLYKKLIGQFNWAVQGFSFLLFQTRHDIWNDSNEYKAETS